MIFDLAVHFSAATNLDDQQTHFVILGAANQSDITHAITPVSPKFLGQLSFYRVLLDHLTLNVKGQ